MGFSLATDFLIGSLIQKTISPPYYGAFTNYVYKRRGVGGQKNRLFVNFYTIENVNGGG